MPTHWTYATFDPAGDLYQGDILRRTDELDSLLAEIHPYFADLKFTAFLIVTQTCDLVLRAGGLCKAEDIGVAGVRALEPLLPAFLERIAGTGVPGVYKKSSRVLAIDLVKKIINQNEVARGLFYLHPDGDAGVTAPSVATLRVTFALQRQHYSVLQGARCGRLDTEFRNKLGWLCGSLFSRIATSDWDEMRGRKETAEHVTNLLKDLDGDGREFWIPERWIDAAKKAKATFDWETREEAIAALREHAPPPAIDIAVSRVGHAARHVMAIDRAASYRTWLENNGEKRREIGQHLEEQIKSVIGPIPSVAGKIELDDKPISAVTQIVSKLVRDVSWEKPDTVRPFLQSVLDRVTISPTLATALVRLTTDFEPERGARLGEAVEELKKRPLLPTSVYDAIVADAERLAAEPRLANIDKILTRLQNDPEFTQLFREDPLVLLPEFD
jgi:hypothetical protein